MTTRKMSIGIRYGAHSFNAVFYSAAQENRKAIEFHNYHAKDNGEIGMKFYCKKCLEETKRTDLLKGYNISKDKIAYFTDEELKARFANEAGIQIISIAKDPIPSEQIKECYFLEIPNDKKALTHNSSYYNLLTDWLSRNEGAYFVAVSKLNSRGIKGGDLSVIKFDPHYNRLLLMNIYYAEELVQEKPLQVKAVNKELLSKAADKLFNTITPISLASLKEEQTEKVLGAVEERLNNPSEAKFIPQDIEIQSEERLLEQLIEG
jgi:non-homologous end joining protein Ku